MKEFKMSLPRMSHFGTRIIAKTIEAWKTQEELLPPFLLPKKI